jgi:molybdenum cofactor synthesis domain-containing protein
MSEEASLPRTGLVIVASTRTARGLHEDRSGPLLVDWLRSRGFEAPDPRVIEDRVVEEELGALVEDRERLPRVVLISGGTGLNAEDRTVDALRPHLDKEVPGIAQAFWDRGLESTPAAVLSRTLAGVVERSFLMALPGSRGGAEDAAAVLDPLIEHILRQLEDYHEH